MVGTIIYLVRHSYIHSPSTLNDEWMHCSLNYHHVASDYNHGDHKRADNYANICTLRSPLIQVPSSTIPYREIYFPISPTNKLKVHCLCALNMYVHAHTHSHGDIIYMYRHVHTVTSGLESATVTAIHTYISMIDRLLEKFVLHLVESIIWN